MPDKSERVIRLSSEDFDSLMFVLGAAASSASRDHKPELFWMVLRLANAINKGNPNFTPYDFEEPRVQ